MRIASFALPVFVVLVPALALQVLAQTERPLRIENEAHHFAFTVMQDSLVTYEDGGDGFYAIYNSHGGGKGTQPDYGLIVYGADSHRFSSEEAEAAGFGSGGEVVKSAIEFAEQAGWQAAYAAQMELHGRGQGGTAAVTMADGAGLDVPFYQWSVVAGMKRAHALTYVLLHGDSFVHVQVESSQELSASDVAWLTTKLELLEAADAG